MRFERCEHQNWMRKRIGLSSRLSFRNGCMVCCIWIFFILVPIAQAQKTDDPPTKTTSIKSAIQRLLDREADIPDEPPEPKRAVVQNRFEMDERRWTEQIFAQLGGSEATFEQALRRRVRLFLNRVDLLITPSEALREKVLATVELEIQRFKTDVQVLVSEAPENPTQEEYQNFYQRVWQLIQPYQAQAWMDNNSPKTPLWKKVFQTQLSTEERATLSAENADRKRFEADVSKLEVLLQVTRRLGLTATQRVKLEEYGKSMPSQWPNLDVAWQVLQQFPEKTKSELFTPYQIEQLKKPLDRSDDLQPIILMLNE